MTRFLRALAPAAAFALFGSTHGASGQDMAPIVPLTVEPAPDKLPPVTMPGELAIPTRPAEAIACPPISEAPAAFDFKNVPPVRCS